MTPNRIADQGALSSGGWQNVMRNSGDTANRSPTGISTPTVPYSIVDVLECDVGAAVPKCVSPLCNAAPKPPPMYGDTPRSAKR